MSAFSLARKWRPKDFSTVAGQDHVVKTLIHSIEQNRLHHAWLFSGSHGIGKTSIARILAKSLSCTGHDNKGSITSNPCNFCYACQQIDKNCFADYIEMDGASHRGVEDITQLLEKVIYMPIHGRFKIYMIDEVHMLTTHAFNAMLKILEEPPEHIKFILATTDAQKIPNTVLSRCLKLNLKKLSVPIIVEYLKKVLNIEKIFYEAKSLYILAKSAQGSMRDALSLTDQAIAYSENCLKENTVRNMLGILDVDLLYQLVLAVSQKNGETIINIAKEINKNNLSFSSALGDLTILLQKIAIIQIIPKINLNEYLDGYLDIEKVLYLSNLLKKEDVQMYYQIAVTGYSDLFLAPDEEIGFTMTLLRMLTFQSDQSSHLKNSDIDIIQSIVSSQSNHSVFEEKQNSTNLSNQSTEEESLSSLPQEQYKWQKLIKELPITNLVRELAFQTQLKSWIQNSDRIIITLLTPMIQLANIENINRFQENLSVHLKKEISLKIEFGDIHYSLAIIEKQNQKNKQKVAEKNVQNNNFIQTMKDELGGTVISHSIRLTE